MVRGPNPVALHIEPLMALNYKLMLTNCVRPAKYEENHERTTPSRPYDFCNRVSKVSWSTLSNAADRSNKVNIARSPESKANKN